MLKRQVMELFKEYDINVQMVIAQVIKFEQENITRDRPSYKNEIMNIIDRVIADETRKDSA